MHTRNTQNPEKWGKWYDKQSKQIEIKMNAKKKRKLAEIVNYVLLVSFGNILLIFRCDIRISWSPFEFSHIHSILIWTNVSRNDPKFSLADTCVSFEFATSLASPVASRFLLLRNSFVFIIIHTNDMWILHITTNFIIANWQVHLQTNKSTQPPITL